MGVPAVGGGLGIVGVLLFVVLNVLGGGGGAGGFSIPSLGPVDAPSQSGGTIPPDDESAQFVAFVLEDVQLAWEASFAEAGRTYERTTLVLFEQATHSGCGVGQSATGPFYCPRDRKVYIDLGFYRELSTRFGAPGDFAQAYVIAHEVGHHVQTVLGISEQVDTREEGVKLELQADCFAGVWGHAAERDGLLERGDLEEGLAAAAAVGDDRIQERTSGRIDPESWTHGSSEQRQEWFTRGFETGDPEACDTFG